MNTDTHLLIEESLASATTFTDADTGQIVAMVPELDLSGYGETKEKALEMLRFSLGQHFRGEIQ